MNKRFSFHPIVDSLIKILIFGSIILLPLLLLVSDFTDKPMDISAVVKKIGSSDTIQSYPDAVILGTGLIEILQPSTLIQYLAPRKWGDPVFDLFLVLIATTGVIYFWDFAYKTPFTRKALIGLQVILVLLIVLTLTNVFRYEWFDGEIRTLTNGQYRYEKNKVIGSVEFWLALALVRVVKIFQKGLRLQRDQDLTV